MSEPDTMTTAMTTFGFMLEALLASDRPWWVWLLAPCALLLLGAGFALLSLRRGGAAGRRRAATALLVAVAAGTVAAVAFAALNLAAAIDSDHKLSNVGLWFLGTLLGAAVVLALGHRLTARRASNMES